MAVTIADVAARAGVSKTTVSRVLNHKGDISPGTAARVLRAIEELGYVPNSVAVALARGNARNIGVLTPVDLPHLPTLNSSWMAQVLDGVARALQASTCNMLLFADRGERSVQRFAPQLSARGLDGLLVIQPEGTLDYCAALHEGGTPVVLIDDRGHHPAFPSVTTTNVAGAEAAARHLREIGRSRPLVITGNPGFACTRQRREGFERVYREAGLPIMEEYVVSGDFSFAAGLQAVQHALAAGLDFDAVFAHNDLSALGALRALRQAGHPVPERVALVGFDDLAQTRVSDPPLTTVRQPLTEMGEAAARMLVEFVEGSPSPRTAVVIPTTLEVRGTTVSGTARRSLCG